jgi:hypothetical protein
MDTKDAKRFEELKSKRISKAQGELQSLRKRIDSVLDTNDPHSLSQMTSRASDKQKKEITKHIRGLTKLKPDVEVMWQEIKKLEDENPQKEPQKYHDLEALSLAHTKFFTYADRTFSDPRTRDWSESVKKFYDLKTPMKNANMVMIGQSIKTIWEEYQHIRMVIGPKR